ncbi:MAG TPA: hypothetical protein VJS44_21465 [Pyrinomonadaceae bacterium]|nr:hypothetical protein [Pyrinomonadaceae bacterium]
MGRIKLLVASLALLFLLPVAASAYTIILLTGRSVEIPAGFSVTRAGITYEHSPGLYVTIQMSTIDVAATERANNEPPGSLLRRAGERTGAQGAAASPANGKGARRTLTDKELEPLRRRREASEAVYERRRVELGLPSAEEMRRQREEETRRINEMAAESEAEKAQSESYWRARAQELRTAMAVNDSEINYLRSRLSEVSSYPTVAFTTIAPFPFVARVPGRPRRGSIGFGGGSTRGRISFNPRGSYTGYRRPTYVRQGIGVLPLPVYAPYGYDQSYEQSVIAARLRELESERAGLQARWRLLEDEARRAGAPPGWLRP